MCGRGRDRTLVSLWTHRRAALPPQAAYLIAGRELGRAHEGFAEHGGAPFLADVHVPVLALALDASMRLPCQEGGGDLGE